MMLADWFAFQAKISIDSMQRYILLKLWNKTKSELWYFFSLLPALFRACLENLIINSSTLKLILDEYINI